MKKYILLLILNLLIVIPNFTDNVFAEDTIKINVIASGNNIIITDENVENITRKTAFMFYSDFLREITPNSFKYINLTFKDTPKGTDLYEALQILVYHDMVDNTTGRVYKDKELNAFVFYALSDKILGTDSLGQTDQNILTQRIANTNDIYFIKQLFLKELNESNTLSSELDTKKMIFKDVLNTLSNEHYDKANSSESILMDSAIEGLAKGTGDKHTTYFPPVKTNTFKEALDGEFEGIGAYVDMETPGVFKIVSPITGSPANQAGLKGGDIITKVDGKEITKETSSSEVVSWIKGEKGSVVILTIKRGTEIFDVEVTRDKIIINDVETEVINRNTFYINISNFGTHVSSEFKMALEELKLNTQITKVIIDVRNNGGGYLQQVTDMLSYMIPEGEPTAIIKYLNGDKIFTSSGYELVDFSKYKIVVLQNSGTASASEILAGTIKDYYPESVSIGEQSYGKGSVQQIKQYKNGSLLKYTVAKWYTGGTETSISGVGLTPDIEIEFNIDGFKKYKQDNQLNKALKVR